MRIFSNDEALLKLIFSFNVGEGEIRVLQDLLETNHVNKR